MRLLSERIRAGLTLLVFVVAMGKPLPAAEVSPESLAEGGHWKRLRALIEPRAAANPNDSAAVYWLARVKQVFGDADGARTLAEKAATLDDSSARIHLLLAEIYGDAAQHASFFRQPGLAGRFRKEAERAIALDPKQIDARLYIMEFYWQAPGIMGGDKKKAAAMAEEIGHIDAARGYLAQADLAFKEKEKDLAKIENLYRKAVEADPKSYRAVMALAGLLASDARKQYEEAEKLARAAAALAPDRTAAYAILAQGLALQERWAELDVILARSEKENPDDLNPTYQAGRILLTTGKDLPRAERYLRKYLTQEPEAGTPHLAAAHWRLGLVLEKMSRKPEAVAELQTAVKLKPDFEPAKKDLKRLK